VALRTVIVELWTGALAVQRFGPAVTVEQLAVLTDADVLARLQAVGASAIPATAEGRRERLAGYPTPADLDAVASDWTSANDGVKPTVRVLEQAPHFKRMTAGAGAIPR
jgi:hypothetical protein